MSNLPIFDVAGSALQAQSVRLNTIASNLSNADSIASSPDAVYKPIEPVFKAVPASGDGSLTGVQVKQIEQTNAAPIKRYDPGHPLADETGHYDGSNVDLVIEIADAREAQRSYEANLRMFDQTRQMTQSLFDLLRR